MKLDPSSTLSIYYIKLLMIGTTNTPTAIDITIIKKNAAINPNGLRSSTVNRYS